MASHSLLSTRRLTEVGQPPEAQVKTLMRIERGFGSFSLQKALEEALSALRPTPPYGLREVLVLSGSLCTVDPGDVFQTVSACSKAKARVSVVGMGGELHVFRRAARDTGGTYGIALSENHFEVGHRCSWCLGHRCSWRLARFLFCAARSARPVPKIVATSYCVFPPPHLSTHFRLPFLTSPGLYGRRS